MKFIQPTTEQKKRMTVRTILSLLDTLRSQRKVLVEPFDNQIEFYENLLEEKRKEQDAKASS